MNADRFEQLKASVIEAGQIGRRQRTASREFKFEIVAAPQPMDELWAICIDSDDPKLLIPRKLYLVKYGESGVWVRDENGEMTSCDSDDFLPLAFEPKVQELLALAA